jgi:hypothetical protein
MVVVHRERERNRGRRETHHHQRIHITIAVVHGDASFAERDGTSDGWEHIRRLWTLPAVV